MRWTVPQIILLVSLNPSAYALDGCEDGTAPVAANALAPLQEAAGKLQHKSIQTSVDLKAQSKVEKTAVVDFTNDFFNILKDPKNPGYTQASSDAAAADAVYDYIMSGASTLGGGSSPIKIHPALAISAPILYPTQNPPTTLAELGAYLNKQHLSQAATFYLIAKITAKVGDHYGTDPQDKPPTNLNESLERTFQTLRNGKNDAGICGPIHVFGAWVSEQLGMKEPCSMSADWTQKGATTGAHDIACFRDPSSKKFYWLNYGDLSQTRSQFLSEAAHEQALNMSPISTSVTAETRTLAEKSRMHQMQGNRSRELMNSVHSVGAPDAPGLVVKAGTLHNEVEAQRKIVGNQQNKVGVFAVGVEDRTELKVQAGVAGVYGHTEGSKPISKSLSVNGKVDGEAGGFIIHDETPKGNGFSDGTRLNGGVLVTGRGEANLAWATSKNKGKVGVDAKYDQLIYASKSGTATGQPYNEIGVHALDDVTKNIEVHARAEGYYFISGMWKPVPSKPELNSAYENVGVTTKGSLDHSKLTLSNSVDGYTFGRIGSGATGLRDEFRASYQGGHGVQYSVAGEGSKVFNTGDDFFFDAPNQCKAQIEAEKKFGRASISLSAQKACNEHRIFTYMQDGSLPQGYSTVEPKTSGSIKLNF